MPGKQEDAIIHLSEANFPFPVIMADLDLSGFDLRLFSSSGRIFGNWLVWSQTC